MPCKPPVLQEAQKTLYPRTNMQYFLEKKLNLNRFLSNISIQRKKLLWVSRRTLSASDVYCRLDLISRGLQIYPLNTRDALRNSYTLTKPSHRPLWFRQKLGHRSYVTLNPSYCCDTNATEDSANFSQELCSFTSFPSHHIYRLW